MKISIKKSPYSPKEEYNMKLTVHSFPNGERFPDKYAFCIPADQGHVTFAPNYNPHLSWSDAPDGTKSFAVILTDPDVPYTGEDVNQEGKTVPKDLPRVDFFHWVLVDIPPAIHEIPEGADSKAVTPKGKEVCKTDYGLRGINNYTNWFESDKEMHGYYGGYDGPCPPWNDERVHRYFFKVYALDIETLGLTGIFGAPEALKTMKGHILAEAEWMGSYTLNKDLL